MKLYSIILTIVNENGTNVFHLGIVSEENLEEVKKQFPKILMDNFLEDYEEDDLEGLVFDETKFGLRGYFDCDYDEREIYAYESEVDDISAKNWKTIV